MMLDRLKKLEAAAKKLETAVNDELSRIVAAILDWLHLMLETDPVYGPGHLDS